MSLFLTELLCIVVPPFLLPESSEVLRSDMSLKADELGVAAMKRSELAAGYAKSDEQAEEACTPTGSNVVA
jgi:hypothetical protein